MLPGVSHRPDVTLSPKLTLANDGRAYERRANVSDGRRPDVTFRPSVTSGLRPTPGIKENAAICAHMELNGLHIKIGKEKTKKKILEQRWHIK